MKLIISFIFFTLSFQSAYAKSAKLADSLSLEDQKIYSATSAMCDRTPTTEYIEKAQFWATSFQESSLMSFPFTKKSPLKMSSRLDQFTSSLGFHLALTKCFGDDVDQKALFVYSLIALDVSGKFLMWTLDITFFKALYAGMVNTQASAALAIKSSTFKNFLLGFRATINKPIFFQKMTSTHIGIYSGLANLGITIATIYDDHRMQKKITTDNSPEKIKKLEKEIATYVEKMNSTKDPAEVPEYQKYIRQNQEQIEQLRQSESKKPSKG
ncbi:MAG: hypothetical protein H7061_01020 [Bdellovibrionaceae bacterium]|nr:hypothetical protein [Bdellovibrio sp.]